MKSIRRLLKYTLVLGIILLSVALINLETLLNFFEKKSTHLQEKHALTNTKALSESEKSKPLVPTESKAKLEINNIQAPHPETIKGTDQTEAIKSTDQSEATKGTDQSEAIKVSSSDEKMKSSNPSSLLIKTDSSNPMPSHNSDTVAHPVTVRSPAAKKLPPTKPNHAQVTTPYQQPTLPKEPSLSLASRFDFKNGNMLIQIGFFYMPPTGTQDIGISGLIGDRFTVTSQESVNILVGLGYFVEDTKVQLFKLSYGINAYYLARSKVSGDVYQEHLYNNLSYQYQQTNIPIYASAKGIIPTKYEHYSIALDAGIGPNIIQNNFVETSLDGGVTLPDYIFSGKTTVNFSAAVGIGLRVDHVLKDRPFECGYRFFYLGNAMLNAKNDQVLNSFNTGSNYAHTMICAVIF